jgi:hypothetical protein
VGQKQAGLKSATCRTIAPAEQSTKRDWTTLRFCFCSSPASTTVLLRASACTAHLASSTCTHQDRHLLAASHGHCLSARQPEQLGNHEVAEGLLFRVCLSLPLLAPGVPALLKTGWNRILDWLWARRPAWILATLVTYCLQHHGQVTQLINQCLPSQLHKTGPVLLMFPFSQAAEALEKCKADVCLESFHSLLGTMCE